MRVCHPPDGRRRNRNRASRYFAAKLKAAISTWAPPESTTASAESARDTSSPPQSSSEAENAASASSAAGDFTSELYFLPVRSSFVYLYLFSRFHHLSEFDQKKRSCRRRLSGHNSRRRKSLLARTTLLPSSCSGATASLSFLIPPTSSSSESAWSDGALQMDSSPGQSRLLQCSARSCEGHSRASREGCFVCAADQRAAAEAGVPRQLFRASPVSTIFTSSCL